MFLLTAFVTGLVCVLVVVLDVKKRNKRQQHNSASILRLQKSNYGTITESTANINTNQAVTNNSNTNEVSLESSTITQLGQVPSAGTWERDITGNYLSHFVVLILFLMFSCLVVSTVVMVTRVHGYVLGYSCGILATSGQ